MDVRNFITEGERKINPKIDRQARKKAKHGNILLNPMYEYCSKHYFNVYVC